MRNRVILVEPAGVQANIFADYMRLPLMGPIMLGTLLKKAGFDVTVFNENIMRRRVKPADLDADILGLTLITPSAKRGYDIARMFRQLNPSGRIVIGGVHPTFLPEEALEVADHVVTGEGESVVVDLFKHGSDQKIIQGERIEDLDSLPMPDLSLIPNHRSMRILPLMTSRGCPHQCNFCSVTAMYGKRFRAHSVERVLEEMASHERRDYFVYDDNFSGNLKRFNAILDGLLNRNVRASWSAQVRAGLAKNADLVEKMHRAGCSRVYIGFESINAESLREMQKGQTPETVRHAVETFHKHHIAIHGMFMFGMDADTRPIFQDTAKFCRRHRLESVQFLILTPLPGTGFWRRMQKENRLLHTDWDLYDGMHVVHRPARMSPAQLQQGMIEAFEGFYSYLSILDEAVDIIPDVLMNIVNWKRMVRSTGALKRTLVKLSARKIISDWMKTNRAYMRNLLHTHA